MRKKAINIFVKSKCSKGEILKEGYKRKHIVKYRILVQKQVLKVIGLRLLV